MTKLIIILSAFSSLATLSGCSGPPGTSAVAPADASREPVLGTSTPFEPLQPTLRSAEGVADFRRMTSTPNPVATLTGLLSDHFFTYNRFDLSPAAEAILERVNRERRAVGVGPLHASQELNDLAFLRAKDMVARDYFGHVDPESGVALAWSLLTTGGYEGKIAENLFATTASLERVPEATLARWLANPENRGNLLDPDFSGSGVGLMGDGVWWKVVALFAEGSR